jgi:hypothetical protein
VCQATNHLAPALICPRLRWRKPDHRLLEGEDVINTAKAMRAWARRSSAAARGLDHSRRRRRRISRARAPLDFGNSGTGCRLVMGAVAGCPITASLDGDASLEAADASACWIRSSAWARGDA